MLDLLALTAGSQATRPRPPVVYNPPWAMGHTEYELWSRRMARHVPPENSVVRQVRVMASL
jgi:hypothetical protein